MLAKNISRYRRELHFTQEELAARLNITGQAVSKWETGQAMPDVALLSPLAHTLRVSVDKLLGYTAAFDETSCYEDAYRGEGYYWGVNPSPMCLKVLALLPPEKPYRLLDIGCGEGKDAVFFARCGYDVSACDLADSGIEKAKRLAELAHVHIRAFKADINDLRLDKPFDIIYSTGVLHYMRPALRAEALQNYRDHTNPGGLNAFHVFVKKPFIPPPPEREEAYLWRSGELLTHYHDWLVEGFEERVFDCASSGVPHRHAANCMYARKTATPAGLE